MYSEVQRFEDCRWLRGDQIPVWRHQAALSLVRREPVLDVGGGDGLLLRLLRERKQFQQLKMVDLSPVAVQKAQQNGIDAQVVDVTQPLPFPDQTFGTATVLDVLEHVYDPLALLRELRRVACEVVIAVPNFQFVKDRVQMLGGTVPFQSKPRRGHVYWFNPHVLRSMIQDAGMVVDAVELAGFKRIPFVGAQLAAMWPSLFAYSIAIRATRGQVS